MFLEVELLLDVVPEQVSDLLVVDLQVGGVNQILHILAGVDSLEGRKLINHNEKKLFTNLENMLE